MFYALWDSRPRLGLRSKLKSTAHIASPMSLLYLVMTAFYKVIKEEDIVAPVQQHVLGLGRATAEGGCPTLDDTGPSRSWIKVQTLLLGNALSQRDDLALNRHAARHFDVKYSLERFNFTTWRY